MSEEISPLENHNWWMERLRKDAKAIRPEALRLADALDNEFVQGRISNHTGRKAAAELRRLHELNEELLEALKQMLEVWEEDPAYGATHAERTARAAIAKAEGKV
jgi:hypothetical protein